MNSGISLIRGALLARGITVQRDRVINCMRRVDPVSQSLRRTATIYRRQYSVPGPNCLWYHAVIIYYCMTCCYRHVDSNHKLIRWKLIVHGGINM